MPSSGAGRETTISPISRAGFQRCRCQMNIALDCAGNSSPPTARESTQVQQTVEAKKELRIGLTPKRYAVCAADEVSVMNPLATAQNNDEKGPD